MRRARFRRAHVDGVIHAETSRRVNPGGVSSHVLLCGNGARRYVQPGDELLVGNVAVTCLWCASWPV